MIPIRGQNDDTSLMYAQKQNRQVCCLYRDFHTSLSPISRICNTVHQILSHRTELCFVYLLVHVSVRIASKQRSQFKQVTVVCSIHVHQYQVRFTNRNPTERSFVLYRCEIRPAKIQTSVHHCCGFLHRLHRSNDPPQVVQDRDHQKEVVQTNHACRARFNDVQYRLELLFPGKAAHFVVNDRDRAKPLVQVMNRERHQHNH